MLRNSITYRVTEQEEGFSVERFLRAHGFSRRLLIHTKYQPNGLLLDGQPTRTNVRVHTGQILCATLFHTEENENLCAVKLPLSIVYEDMDCMVLNKPAGMPVHPSHGHYEDTVCNALAYYYQQQKEPFTARPVGRLDRDTSGLVLFARHELSACVLAEQMRNREIHREYRAICTGILPKEGVIDAPIARAAESTIARVVDFEHGERAVTHYQTLLTQDGFSLAAVKLETGRTHQIRVHMQYIGHPLPGDFLYNPDMSRIGRQTLHSARLCFLHPITGEKLDFSAPLPADMKAFFPNYSE